MSRIKTEVKVERVFYRNRLAIVVVQNRADGRRFVARPLVMHEIDESSEIIEPTMELTTEEGQLLMDELWRCGLRPSEGTGSAGSLAATERHLKDMQTIAMGLLRKEF